MKISYYLPLLLLFISIPASAQVDYESQIQPIFSANCTSCHGVSGGVTLTSYDALMNSTGNQYGSDVIVPGDPDASGLVDKISNESPDFGDRMPQGGTPLDDEEIALIRTWIAEGATEVPTSSERELTEPKEFRLLGNYPNPFNPTTQIRFSAPVAAQYTISVFTVHGKLISEHVGSISAGVATIDLNMASNQTGVYFYKVVAVSNNQARLVGTGRMTLIK